VDGTPCTLDQCDGFGQCFAGGAPSGCAGAAPGKASLQYKNEDPAKAKLEWKWTSAAAFDTSSLGNPAVSDALSLCVYDGTGFRFDAIAPAGGICGRKPCWSVATDKLKYKDKDATPDGVSLVKAKSGAAGKGKAMVQAKGPNLVLPPLALTPPVQAYLVRGDGPVCLQATYSTAEKNEAGRYKAKSD
jgi:hypothetical protein